MCALPCSCPPRQSHWPKPPFWHLWCGACGPRNPCPCSCCRLRRVPTGSSSAAWPGAARSPRRTCWSGRGPSGRSRFPAGWGSLRLRCWSSWVALRDSGVRGAARLARRSCRSLDSSRLRGYTPMPPCSSALQEEVKVRLVCTPLFFLYYNLKWRFTLWICKILSVNFQHHYSSLQCHMILQKSF